MRRTKIVCTLGPASQSEVVLAAMIRAGMRVARLNFSHGTHDDHRRTLETVRRVAADERVHVGILQDLCGPKIRLGELAADAVTLVPGARFVLTSETRVGDADGASVSHSGLARDVAVGSRVLLDDGLLELAVEEVRDKDVVCRVIVGGALRAHKGVNFPGVTLSVPAFTAKDRDDLLFGLELGVDFVALSFVRSAAEVVEVKRLIRENGHDIPVIAKIEKFEALHNLEEIVQAADGIMVARGDLGVETALERVPIEQKRMIALARRQHRVVITATQMLDSMIRNPRPTRAEAADVANAVLDGTDAVMLSGETAVGAYPAQTVGVMAAIASAAEEALPYERVKIDDLPEARPTGTLALAACEIAERLRAAVIVACTVSGSTARHLSHFRPRAPIAAMVESDRLARRLILWWGVEPVVIGHSESTEQMLRNVRHGVLESGLARPGELAVIQAGVPPGVRGSTNTLKIDVLGHAFFRGISAGVAGHVSGRVTRATTADEAASRLREGDVLVVPVLDASFASVLSRAGAIVAASATEDARRLLEQAGVPGVFDVVDAEGRLAEGLLVTVDCARGMVSYAT